MKIEHSHIGSNNTRYLFDSGMCSLKNGYAQIDTKKDAPYYGTWTNPITLDIVNFCEGDLSIYTAENRLEYIKEIRDMQEWETRNGYGFGIDAGCSKELIAIFESLGFSALLH